VNFELKALASVPAHTNPIASQSLKTTEAFRANRPLLAAVRQPKYACALSVATIGGYAQSAFAHSHLKHSRATLMDLSLGLIRVDGQPPKGA
jgi:hypothetical protein